MRQTREYCQPLPYTRLAEGIHDGDGHPYWVAWIDELSGCKTDGATFAEAMGYLNAVFDDYIEGQLEFDSDIPVLNRSRGHRERSNHGWLPPAVAAAWDRVRFMSMRFSRQVA